MVLNQFAKTAAAHPNLEPRLKTAMLAPADEKAARAHVDALGAELELLRKTGDKRKLASSQPSHVVALGLVARPGAGHVAHLLQECA